MHAVLAVLSVVVVSHPNLAALYGTSALRGRDRVRGLAEQFSDR